MRPSEVCILLTVHCTRQRVVEYNRSFVLWQKSAHHFKRVVSVDSVNNQYISTTHRATIYNKSPSLGEKYSIITALASLYDCPFIFKWTGRYYTHEFQNTANVPSDASFVMQSVKSTRGQNSEVFGTTLDGLLLLLSKVRRVPYTSMETALLESKTNTTWFMPFMKLAFAAEQKSRHRILQYI